MLENLNLELIFKKSAELGLSNFRIYAERTTTTHVEIEHKDQRARHMESGGLSVEYQTSLQGCWTTLRTNQFTTESVLDLLGLNPHEEKAVKAAPKKQSDSFNLGKKISTLQLLVRKINLDNSLSQPVSFSYREKRQRFQFCSHPNRISEGEIEQGEAQFDVQSSFRGNPLCFSHKLSSSDLETLEKDLQKIPEQIQAKIQLGSTEKWPLPEGNIPVGWSCKALAKITSCFVRGFEGDLVLKNFSYLAHATLPFKFNFSIEEQPLKTNHLIDHEGSPKKNRVIFDGQKPRALATDCETAQAFAVESTGHSRREAFDRPSSIGFWHAVLKGHEPVASVLELMTEGIWVEEIEIEELDLISGYVTLNFSQANLVHQGQIGESIKPFNWTLSLEQIMGSLHHFSKESQTTGLFHIKQKQRILTEYTMPSALSLNLKLPGSVPKTHYW
ncbi:MAG: metallopeptidase TldD-related protein [Deltaproteobacteria bacterium]